MRRNNIPDGWLLKKLNQISTFESGGTPSKGVDEFWVNGDIKWLSAKYIDQDKIIGCDYITKQGLDNSSAKMTKFGDIILVTRVSVGKIVFVEEEFAVNQDLTIIKTDDTNKKFLFYVLKNKTKDIIDKSQGLAIKGITKEELSNIKVLVPPLPEQKKIAEILGTWDRAIEELTDLIAEKKELKRGLMQRLLTGTQRLPGFSASWKQVKLAELFDVKKGAGLSKDVLDKEGKESCILYGELYTTYPEIVRSVISRTDISEGVRSEYGDILIPGSTTTTGIDLANATALLEEGVLLGGDINILRKKQELSSEFFAYLLTHAYRFELAKLAQGITIVHLYGESLKNVDVVVPTDTAEQKAIADVLSKADAEIDLLNQRLDVLKEQKRGLMQKLLTGEIRVKVDNE